MLILIDENGTQGHDQELIQKLHEVFGLVICKSEGEAVAYLEKKTGGGSGTARRDAVPNGSGQGNVIALHAAPQTPNGFGRGLPDLVDELESRMVHEAMSRTGNNQVRAAELLKITRGALQYKLKKFVVKKEAA